MTDAWLARRRFVRDGSGNWSGDISNPLEVIEQIAYLLFSRRPDELQTRAEWKAHITGGALNCDIADICKIVPTDSKGETK